MIHDEDMTAFESFGHAIDAGYLPAAVPLDGGLVNVVFATLDPGIRSMATGSQEDRAKLAVYACNAAFEVATLNRM